MVESATDKIEKHLGTAVRVPVVGSVMLPRPERLAYYVGLGLLAAFEVVE
jgi:hypothetical protein